MVRQSGSVHETQWLAVHVLPAAQVPQLSVPPQPFDTVPHVRPLQAPVVGVQHALAWQTWPVAQVSVQVMVPPQPSATVPQATLAQACIGGVGVQHALLWQTWLAAHVLGHWTVPPHPFGAVPHATPAQAVPVVFGVQQASPSQTSPVAHVSGQVTVPPHPFGAVPHATPAHAVPGVWGAQQLPPLQTWPPPHVPHETVAPHASVTLPHVLPISWQRFVSPGRGSQVPCSHCSPAGQPPQLRIPPQPLLATPHDSPSFAQVVVAQVSHWYVTASQTSGAVQVPQVKG
jgi:hypothetical protein